ncbi:hypothetical protein LWI29_029779 [Acer saccharum]|uniref:Uncharacterized protein n=1 Tax=Acer saccharum TaxID=4024 RepID=A0AA39RLV9_ACESA|nr:hypothetical protein LWI29_029779 [Acer saccharum]
MEENDIQRKSSVYDEDDEDEDEDEDDDDDDDDDDYDYDYDDDDDDDDDDDEVDDDDDDDDDDDEPRKIDKKIRGKSRGVRLDRLITSANGQLHVDFSSGKPKGPNAEMFSTEIGIVVRSHAPLNVEKLDDIPEEQT